MKFFNVVFVSTAITMLADVSYANANGPAPGDKIDNPKQTPSTVKDMYEREEAFQESDNNEDNKEEKRNYVGRLQASDRIKDSSGEDEYGWFVTVGAGIGYGSIMQGAAEREIFFAPVLSIDYKNWSFDFDTLSYIAYESDTFALSGSVGYDFGREEDDLPAKARGVGDVEGGARAGISASYFPTEWLGLSVDVTKSFSDADSLLVSVGAETGFPVYGDSLFGGLSASMIWANEKHMKSFYGVNETQSIASGLSVYTPKAGLESISLSADLTYEYDEQWTFGAGISVDLLQSNVKDSPFIDKSVQPNVFLGVSYTF